MAQLWPLVLTAVLGGLLLATALLRAARRLGPRLWPWVVGVLLFSVTAFGLLREASLFRRGSLLPAWLALLLFLGLPCVAATRLALGTGTTGGSRVRAAGRVVLITVLLLPLAAGWSLVLYLAW